MQVLVTGAAGTIGPFVVDELHRCGHHVRSFDLRDGLDVRDDAAVRRATIGMDAVVHMAAVQAEAGIDAATMMATNVGGTWNVLQAAVDAAVGRVVFASSVNALGVFRGLRAPDYLPIDDDHPAYATSAYGTSKLLGEELCDVVTRTTGLTTVCLRIPWVLQPGAYPARRRRVRLRDRLRDGRRDPYAKWEYGAFLDVRDLADACRRAVERDLSGHTRVLLTAAETPGRTSPLAIADLRFPGIAWHDRARFEHDDWLPLVDASVARDLLGWIPRHPWEDGSPLRSARWRRRRDHG